MKISLSQKLFYILSVIVCITFSEVRATSTDESALSELSNRVNELEDQNREMTGLLEETRHESQSLKSRLDTALSDLELRLNDLEGHKGVHAHTIAPSAAEAKLGQEELPIPLGESVKKDASGNLVGALGDAKGSKDTAAITPTHKAESEDASEPQYEKARVLLEKGDYEAAEKAFAAFVKDHPKDALAGKAQYWLGVTHYVRGNYETAAAAFAKGYKTYGKSDKAPDMLFKLAKSLEAMDRKSDACKALAELQSTHPKVHAADTAKMVKSLSCKN